MSDHRPTKDVERQIVGFPWTKHAQLRRNGLLVNLEGYAVDSLFKAADGAITNLTVSAIVDDGFYFGQDHPTTNGEYIVTLAAPGALPVVYWWGYVQLDPAP